LLHDHSCDAHGYEGVNIAVSRVEALLSGVERAREALAREMVHAAMEAKKPEPDPVCWHCLDVLIPDTQRPRCERCPDECDIEGCEAPGCAGEDDAT
jgi:hypothetical protein